MLVLLLGLALQQKRYLSGTIVTEGVSSSASARILPESPVVPRLLSSSEQQGGVSSPNSSTLASKSSVGTTSDSIPKGGSVSENSDGMEKICSYVPSSTTITPVEFPMNGVKPALSRNTDASSIGLCGPPSTASMVELTIAREGSYIKYEKNMRSLTY
ncbi:uncharacterized protein LOC126579075 [Anopheles aquasalis]|uniref:uncharacterized protein LOC126579075 n=1 Tax=Anopheles aquasalis TaxID=42839 RepID=UPI00215A52A0|nr:uncharacterized protein LOC126579075 [Anopheles aquasalis]